MTHTMLALAALGSLSKGSYEHVGCPYSPQTRWHYAVDLKIVTNDCWNLVFHGLMWFVLKVHIYIYIFFSSVVLLLRAGRDFFSS